MMIDMIWLAESSSGVPAMDELHRNFIEDLKTLSPCNDDELSAEYGAFVGKVERTFRKEEELMEEIDSPVSKVHREQHARVLDALHHVHARVMGGEIGIGREVMLNLFPQWFAFHVSTMDAALAQAIQMKGQ